MRLYKVQTSADSHMWFGTKEEATKRANQLKKQVGWDVKAEQIEVPTTKAELIEFLNNA